MKDGEGNKRDNILDEVEEVVVLIPLNISEEMLLVIFQFDKEVKIVRWYTGTPSTMAFKFNKLNLHWECNKQQLLRMESMDTESSYHKYKLIPPHEEWV